MDEPGNENAGRLEEIFSAARDLDGESRDEFLRSRCAGDAELLRAVRSLLAADSTPGHALDTPAVDVLGQWLESGSTVNRTLPRSFSPYRLLEVLGEGGMGIVYMARHPSMPRNVALKAIQVGMNTKEVVARFEAERHALSLMDHENVARVHDAGASTDGRPFFVMEYVDGLPITEYCDGVRLDVGGRLELFVQACRGVAHAHERGIIHRDLKPSNVLVTTRDGRPLVKIIDFGIAKATNHRLAEHTLYTELGRVVGTPDYMSPEQARNIPGEVSQRSDVYSLGVLLYELAVGVLPFEALSHAAQDEIFRTIREVDPPTPSTRWTRLNVERTTDLAQLRNMSAREIFQKLRGELDWINMKALEKEPRRRYASCAELAADVERHRRRERVIAGPPGLGHRARKFARKNRGPVTAAALVILALTLGMIASLVLFVRSERNADLAEGRLSQVLRLSDLTRVREETARADELWPLTSRNVSRLTDWVARARELSRHLEDHEREAARLRSLDSNTTEGRGIDWWRETLEDLVEEMREFKHSLLPRVEQRLQAARELRSRTIDERRGEWDAAIASIADRNKSPAYDGLVIAPQEGLVPIGRDPESRLWEFVHLQSGFAPARGEDGRLVLEPDVGIVFVLLPGGTFSMGETLQASVPDWHESTEPPHDVTLDPFFIGKYELTRQQYTNFQGEAPPRQSMPHLASHPRAGLLPVEARAWFEFRTLLRRMDLELPTEAQWEYAARAGTTTHWWCGDETDCLRRAGNLADQSNRRLVGIAWGNRYEDWDDHRPGLSTVGMFEPNGFGLHDVIGNVSELCLDIIGSYYLPTREGTGERLGEDPEVWARVRRGGSWWTLADRAGSARRTPVAKDYRHFSMGVRAARSLRR